MIYFADKLLPILYNSPEQDKMTEVLRVLTKRISNVSYYNYLGYMDPFVC